MESSYHKAKAEYLNILNFPHTHLNTVSKRTCTIICQYVRNSKLCKIKLGKNERKEKCFEIFGESSTSNRFSLTLNRKSFNLQIYSQRFSAVFKESPKL